MLKFLKESNDPKVLVITPLLPGHKVSRDTKVTIKRNDIEFDWISYTGTNNIPTNVTLGIEDYKKEFDIPKYLIMIDNDIILGRNMLDKMFNRIKNSPEDVAYTYASFKFEGVINKEFPAIPFNMKKLLQSNYISSNSMIKSSYLEYVDGLVTDEKYKRLLDWAMWLKFLSFGFVGLECPEASFIAKSTEKDISAGTSEDYRIKYLRVYEDFIKPMMEELNQSTREKPKQKDSMIVNVI